MAKSRVRALLVLASVGLLPPAVLADEVVHFTNGSEMPVRSHTVEKGMVKLDLGNSSFIAFPMTMVDKIVNSGQDVFLNPTFHPSNQVVAGGASAAGTGVGDTSIRGTGASVGFAPQANAKPGTAGVMLGEAADALPQDARADSGMPPMDINRRKIYNPAFPTTPGSTPQVIMPPSAKMPGRMTVIAPRVPAPAPGAPVQNPAGTGDAGTQGDTPPDPNK